MYQELFVDEARWAMGQPSIEQIHRMIGQEVEITFSDRNEKVKARIVAIKGDRILIQSEIPWRSIQSITPA